MISHEEAVFEVSLKKPNFDGWHENSPLVVFSAMPDVMSLFEQGSNQPFKLRSVPAESRDQGLLSCVIPAGSSA